MFMKLNHIGLVVPEIETYRETFRLLGLEKGTEPVADPIQKVAASFVAAGQGQDVHIELLEPTDKTSPITNFLKKRGAGLHHLCFEVNDIDAMTRELEDKGFQVVCEPVDCEAYDINLKRNCRVPTRISFLMNPDRLLIELLQKGV